ncbi:NAD(P)-dependent oxidoreductase [Actinophytocola oryzae]|uniref:3-hydroxyisobutyrate dehydrogenase-like beta-hydroxyacid dehydrogenase n=1 Tax=Actinophytocola oryzae TaxID=502181 RepID=A0A4R7W154_9PSEU|nr:NAD(P)-binding domain-containing protein [Actinophytocola oryzae]TDV55247.1 3-hydroxyisobutyrate dehydrogenase-like beta-hydroxyacid dehydrogenase [Actinophytocola oryzae]
MNEPVTVLGLGPMGHAIASAYVAAGHPTTTWNRTATRPTPAGATRLPDATAAVSASGTVVVCLLDYDAARSVLTPLAGTLRGRVVVNVTSGSPDAARSMAAWTSDHEIPYADGAIMTPATTIGTTAATILHSGHPTTALAPLGGTHTYLGADPGRAAAFDVALLDIFWTSVTGVAHAFAMARSENITATELAPLANGIADLLPVVIDDHSARLAKGDHAGTFSNLHSAAAGMAHIIETAEARGIDAGVMRAAHALVRAAVDAGHGTDGVSRLTVELEAARHVS